MTILLLDTGALRQVIKCKKQKCDTVVWCCQTRFHHQRQLEATIIADFAPASSHILHKQTWGRLSRFLTVVERELSWWSWSRPTWYVIHMVISDGIYTGYRRRSSIHFGAMLMGKKGLR